jgi:subtilisin family serine protease
MHRTTHRFLLATALVAAAGCNGELDEALGVQTHFVKLDKEPAEVAAFATELADTFDFELVHTYDAASEGFAARFPSFLADDLEEVDGVDYVLGDEDAQRLPPEEDEPSRAPVDDPIDLLDGREVPESILRVGGAYGGDLSGLAVAVVDSGIDGSHPDLNVVASIDIVAQSGGQAAPDGDPNGHGTHCAGTIGALQNDDGVMGVAPGVALHAVRVLDASGAGYWTDIIAGLEYVLEHPEIRVVNLSLGGPRFDGPDPMEDAIARLEESGVSVVIAAGNESQDTANVAPAGYDIGLIVSAYDAEGGSDNGFAWFTNFGDEVDITAPGVEILSTYPGGTYAPLSGTSMATPLVAGAVAAYYAENPAATPAEAFAAVVSTGEGGYDGQGGKHPEPMLDVEALLR